MPREMTVGQVAERSGLAVSAIRFYEAKGLISSHRSAGNQRRYGSEVLRRLGVISIGQSVGISLAEIGAAFADLPEGRAPSAEDWTRMSLRWGEALDLRIRQLQRLRRGLNDCIGCGCLSVDKCALRNNEDRLSANGPGPHRLVVRRSNHGSSTSQSAGRDPAPSLRSPSRSRC